MAPSAAYSGPPISSAAFCAHTAAGSPIGKPVRKYSGSTTNFTSWPIKRLDAAIWAPTRSIVPAIRWRAAAASLAELTAKQVVCRARAINGSGGDVSGFDMGLLYQIGLIFGWTGDAGSTNATADSAKPSDRRARLYLCGDGRRGRCEPRQRFARGATRLGGAGLQRTRRGLDPLCGGSGGEAGGSRRRARSGYRAATNSPAGDR